MCNNYRQRQTDQNWMLWLLALVNEFENFRQTAILHYMKKKLHKLDCMSSHIVNTIQNNNVKLLLVHLIEVSLCSGKWGFGKYLTSDISHLYFFPLKLSWIRNVDSEEKEKRKMRQRRKLLNQLKLFAFPFNWFSLPLHSSRQFWNFLKQHNQHIGWLIHRQTYIYFLH